MCAICLELCEIVNMEGVHVVFVAGMDDICSETKALAVMWSVIHDMGLYQKCVCITCLVWVARPIKISFEIMGAKVN